MRAVTVVVVAAALAAATPAAASDGGAALAGISLALRRGAIEPAEAAYFRRTVLEARRAASSLPDDRAQELHRVLAGVAAGWRTYDRPGARTLFTMLAVNTRELRASSVKSAHADVIGPNGLVYRSFPGDGLQFHPLASFARLNVAIGRGRRVRMWRMAAALLARGHPRGRSLVWEYHFRFAGGEPPWTSGMVQAVAADAFARLGLRAAARRAFRAVHDGLLLHSPAGPWIRLYRFSDVTVLNAQLQAALSLDRYAKLTGDASAGRLATRLRRSARKLLPRFDTGCWSRYSLGGGPATSDYHRYVVQLLWKLAHRTGEPWWARWAIRFHADEAAPALFAQGPGRALYPFPRDGFRDRGTFSVWVSKCATVTLSVGDRRKTVRLARGRHTLPWRPRSAPGSYRVGVTAVDAAGREAVALPGPLVVRRDRTAPVVRARLSATRLAWRAHDRTTPWVRLVLELRRGGTIHTIPYGRRSFRGHAAVRLADGRWHATLVVRDSTGNATRVPFGGLGAWPNVPR